MSITLDQASETVARAKTNVERDCARLVYLLSFVPDDKLTWIPSETAKSALRIVAHCALVNRNFALLITDAMPESLPTPEEFFHQIHQSELTVTSREAVLALLKETETELNRALDSVDAERFGSTGRSPFGAMPIAFWVDLCHNHLVNHIGQLEYLQTIWGDLDFHLN